MEIILFLIMVYFLCKLIEKAGEWFENAYPSFQEARHKKIRKEKFGVGQPEELLGLERKNLETLDRLAKAFADKVTMTPEYMNMSTEIQKQIWNTNYNYYFNKYKHIYS